MKTKLRIVFMGTPDFAVATLKTLVENQYHIVGVITAPDRPAGRGRSLQESAVKRYAKQQNLHILQPTNLKDPVFLEELKGLEANLQIVVAFRMLPRVVWQMPEYGTFNLHASLLPNYRGAAPINWAIINGETLTGVSTFFIDDKIDTGDMILQEPVAIEPTDTAGDLHDRLMDTGSALVLKTVQRLEAGPVQTIPQQATEAVKEAPKLHRENCKIDWQDTAINIYNKVRGLSPYPAAWALLQNGEDTLEVKLYRCNISHEDHQLEPGSVIATKKTLQVAVQDGFINLLEMKLPGKRLMPISDLLNGYQIQSGAKMR